MISSNGYPCCPPNITPPPSHGQRGVESSRVGSPRRRNGRLLSRNPPARVPAPARLSPRAGIVPMNASEHSVHGQRALWEDAWVRDDPGSVGVMESAKADLADASRRFQSRGDNAKGKPPPTAEFEGVNSNAVAGGATPRDGHVPERNLIFEVEPDRNKC